MPEYQQSWPMPKNPIPIVVFGAGSIVSDAHLPAYKMSNLPIKGIYDPDHEKAKKLGHHYGEFSEKEFSLMKNNSIFINTCRGPVHDEKSLITALKISRQFSVRLVGLSLVSGFKK